jgi:Ni/Co efflux regulator RcnB
MKKLLLAAIAASFFAVGCATPQNTASASASGSAASDERDDGDIVTGSRIKRKDNPQATKVIIQDDASRSEMSRGQGQQNPKGG